LSVSAFWPTIYFITYCPRIANLPECQEQVLLFAGKNLRTRLVSEFFKFLENH